MVQLNIKRSSVSFPVFPLEIFDLIISCLVVDPVSVPTDAVLALRACCLVSKTFVFLCRPHLFYSVEVGPTASAARQRLAKLLIKTPHVSKYIRRISYHSSKNFKFPGDPHIGTLQPILQLPNVDTLTITTVECNQLSRMRYYDDHGFRSFFDHFISKGQLRALYIHGVLGAPLSQILGSPRLETLVVDKVVFSQWGSFFPHGKVDPAMLKIPLKRFSLRDTEFELAALGYFNKLEAVDLGYGLPSLLNTSLHPYHSVSAASFPKLRFLSTCHEWNPVLAICCAARRAEMVAFPAVETLFINIEPNTRKGETTDITPFALWYHLPALTSVKIHLPVTSQSVKSYCLLRLDHCLRVCKNSLKRLSIQADLTDPHHVRDVIQPLHYSLDLARGDNAIEVIEVDLKVNPSRSDGRSHLWDGKAVSSHLALTQWLLTLLGDQSRSGFPMLKNVLVRMCFEGSGIEEGKSGYKACLKAGLRRLVEGRMYPFFGWKVEGGLSVGGDFHKRGANYRLATKVV